MTGIVGRADIGACLFFIASLLAYIRSQMQISPFGWSNIRWHWLLCSLVFSVASMLSKEQGITVLGVCAVYEILFLISNKKKKQNLSELLYQASTTFTIC